MGLEVAEARRGEQTAHVQLSGYDYFAGPVIALVALGVIVLICRWVFATDRPAPRPPAEPVDFGLLEPVALVRTVDDALMLRALLREAGIRGTVADTPDGLAVLVFRDDVSRARALVRS
jgi:hypothetical protein